jgi:uncharacterized damage-inducible protein DinB
LTLSFDFTRPDGTRGCGGRFGGVYVVAGGTSRGRLEYMANTEWWQRGPVAGVPGILQPIAHILLQVRESVVEIVEPLTEQEWNARPAGVASAAFHVRHIAGVIDRLFTYARGSGLSGEQFAAIQAEAQALLPADIATVLDALSARVDAAVAELRAIDVATLTEFRAVGRAQLPSTVIGCLVHGAEHAMRHVGQLSVTARIARSGIREA